MKYLILFLISFNLYASEKMYKIQVFDANGKQLYGLHAKESDREKRLAEATKVKCSTCTLVNVDDSKLFEDRKKEKEDAKKDRKNIKQMIQQITDPNLRKILKRMAGDLYRGL